MTQATDLNTLFAVFKAWLKTEQASMDPESAFICICPDGTGWFGDGVASSVEFDSPEDGIAEIFKRCGIGAEDRTGEERASGGDQ